MSCILSISGTEFRVDEFIKETGLTPYAVFRKGEIHPRRKEGHQYSGCKFDASKAEFDQFAKQKLDAILFLKQNFEGISRVQEFGLRLEEYPTLDFAITTSMLDDDIYVQSDSFEPELLKLAGNLNIEIILSQYPPASEETE
jgi:hypothetical protein